MDQLPKVTQPATYRIRIAGRVNNGWSDFMSSLEQSFDQENGVTVTTITGIVADQAALHGMLEHIRDLNLELISVSQIMARALSQSVSWKENAMKTNTPITKEYFIKRLADLCIKSGLAGFPKDETSLHILLKSAVITFGQLDQFTEREVNAKLEAWVNDISQMKGIDHVSLRRMLVDTGYLTRTDDGSSYQISRLGPRPYLFDESINQLDIRKEIEAAREEIARRKREFVEKSREG